VAALARQLVVISKKLIPALILAIVPLGVGVVDLPAPAPN